MNIQKSETRQPPEKKSRVGAKEIARFLLVLLLMPASLFLISGRWDWWQAWVYFGLYFLITFISRGIILRKYPDLIKERAKFTKSKGVKKWDKSLVPIVVFMPLLVLVVAAFNVRFGWTPLVPAWLQWLALVFIVLGTVFSTWAMAVNPFFSAVVRIQKERGHSVVSSGPYRVVRHPGYAGGLISIIAVPLLLGSLWALIPAGIVVVLYILRTALEDKTLQNELDGYKKYATQVRYRLLPGIW